MTPEILCQYPMTTNRRAVVRLHYDAVREIYSCCIVEAGVCLPDTHLDLTERMAQEHYAQAEENGTVYEPFPGRRHA